MSTPAHKSRGASPCPCPHYTGGGSIASHQHGDACQPPRTSRGGHHHAPAPITRAGDPSSTPRPPDGAASIINMVMHANPRAQVAGGITMPLPPLRGQGIHHQHPVQPDGAASIITTPFYERGRLNMPQDPAVQGPPRLLPIAGGGTTFSSPPHSVGCLTQHASINKTLPLRAGSTAPPAHRGRGGPNSPLHPTPWGV